jgi:hypothetical protein
MGGSSTRRSAVHHPHRAPLSAPRTRDRGPMPESFEPVPELHLRRDAVLDGWSDDELNRLVRNGELGRLRRGAYVNGLLPLDPAARHRLLIRATMPGLRRPAVVSHQSAAVVLGLPLWDVPLDRVHVTRRPRAWNDTGRVLCCHVARLRDDEVIDIEGLQVTGPCGRPWTWRGPCLTRLRSWFWTRRSASAWSTTTSSAPGSSTSPACPGAGAPPGRCSSPTGVARVWASHAVG